MINLSALLNRKHVLALIFSALNIVIIAMAAMSIAASASIVSGYKESIKASESNSRPLETPSYAQTLENLKEPISASSINIALMLAIILTTLWIFRGKRLKDLTALKYITITALILCTDLAAVGPWEHEREHYYTITTTSKHEVCGRSSHTQLYRLEGQHEDPKRMIALTHNAESAPGFKTERSLGQLLERRVISAYYSIRYGVTL